MSVIQNQNRERWIAVAILILLIGLIYLVVVTPLISIASSYQETIDDLEFKLERDRRLALQKATVLRRVDEIKSLQTANDNLFSRESAALATADLQKLVKSTIITAGGDLTSTQVLPSQEEEQFLRIGIRVRMSGNIEVLKSVLFELESTKPILIIDNLTIRPIRGRRNRKTRKLEATDNLNINFEVVGYMRI